MRMFTVEERDGYISVRLRMPPMPLSKRSKKPSPTRKNTKGTSISTKPGAPMSRQKCGRSRGHKEATRFTPSSTYHIFMPGYRWKMSSSIPESIISFYQPETVVRKKVMSGITGGRMTLEEQKRLGGEPDKCSLYLLNLFHMVTDDAELAETGKCTAGEITCGQCKKDTAERVVAFLKNFREKMDACADKITV